ncbi:MAG: chromosome segregation protein SMC [Chitinophagales bacterium]
MRLTKLEIKGFKSFADKTTINFNQNITGVVGPNGSGKSNVVDAMRWVLGEQRSSQLRSEKMDNLIFNGSKMRKSAGLAEVSLSFENTKNIIATEFKEVTVTRKLFRTGDSEYRINDVPCRLKDISNLFLDTGISSDSYAIIELKMIDEILHDRDNSRRKLFEQAAGVSKYKQRKKETLAKLKATDQDLDRVEDLLFEISNNLKTLESQARKAMRYNKIKEEYKELSLELAKMQISELVKSFKTLKKQLEEQEDLKKQQATVIDTLEAAIEKQKVEVLEAEKNLSDRQKTINSTIQEINRQENDKNLATEKIRFNKERIEKIKLQLADQERKFKEIETQLADALIKLEKQQKGISEESDKKEKLEKELNQIKQENEALQKELNDKQIQRQTLEKTISGMEKNAAVNSNQMQNLEKTIAQNKEEHEKRKDQLSKLNEEKKQLSKERKLKKEEIEQLEASEEKLQKNIEAQLQYIEQSKEKLNKENRSLDSKQNEYKLNKSLIDNLEGFPESTKFLKKNVEGLKEAPLLSDIIYCDKEYRASIENYLEPFLNFFIVNDLELANKAIDLLSDSSIGRANFFLLSEFDYFEARPPLIMSGLMPATEIIEVDAEYKKLVAFLLDHVYIVTEKDFSASDIHLKSNPNKDKSLSIISKTGKYIRSDYAISGGAVGLFEGMRLGRTKNLEKLKEEIDELEIKRKDSSKKIKELELSIAGLKKTSRKQFIHIAEQQLNTFDRQIASIDAKIENFTAFVNDSQQKTKEVEERIREMTGNVKDAQKQLKLLNGEKEKADAEYEKVRAKYAEVNQSLMQQSNRFNEQNIQFHQQANYLKNLEQEISFLKKQKQEQQETEKKQLADNANSKTEIEAAELQIEKLNASLQKLYAEKEQSNTALSVAETAYYKQKGNINEAEEKLRKENKTRQQTEQLLTDLKDKLNEVKLEINSLKERLSVEFNIQINDIIDQEADGSTTEEELREKVEKLKSRLMNYGEVNPMAVEAYEEMKERFEFITGQKEDLTKAKASLENTMKEIEDTAQEKFLEAFEQVRQNFQKVFRSLFQEEDDCDLTLTDPDYPLDSKIDILAKPKGKRPQVIDQLSGGEKSLTALAILFSLYLLKPAPFCILDEVDAPLDDANIGKFNDIITDFSKNSQFILVTHNKQTMAAVDVIYGVTMIESGVSRVVPVDFRALKHVS